MDKLTSLEDSSEASHLLSELDLAIDRSSLIREIVSKYERLHSIEQITGPSQRTRLIRSEIAYLEEKLHFEQLIFSNLADFAAT
jgi:hypothetical protein